MELEGAGGEEGSYLLTFFDTASLCVSRLCCFGNDPLPLNLSVYIGPFVKHHGPVRGYRVFKGYLLSNNSSGGGIQVFTGLHDT